MKLRVVLSAQDMGLKKALKDTQNSISNINIDANRSRKLFNDNTKGVTNFGKSFKTAMSVGATAALVGMLMKLGRAISSTVRSSIDSVETQNLFNVSMAETAVETGKAIDKMSELYGLDPMNVRQAVGSFALLGRSMGMTADQGKTLSLSMYQLGTDLSSMMNVPIEQVMRDLKSGLLGQSETVYKYGMDVTEAAIKQEALNQGITKTVRQMSQGEKMALRYSVMIKTGGIVMGDFAKTIEQPANQIKVLQERMVTLSRSIGNIFMPMLEAVLPWLNAFVILLIELANAISAFFGFKATGDENTKSGGNVFTDTEDDANAAGGAVGSATKAVQKFKATILGIDELNLMADQTEPSSSGGGGGGSGLGGGGSFLGDWEPLSYESMMNSIPNKAKAIADMIRAEIAKGDWRGIGNTLGSLLNDAVSSIDSRHVGQTIGGIINKGLLVATGFMTTTDFAGIGQSFANLLNGALDAIDFSAMGELLATKFTAIASFLVGVITNFDFGLATRKIIDFVEGFVDEIVRFMTTTDWSGLGRAVVDGVLDVFANLDLGQIMLGIGRLINSIFSGVFDLVGGAIEAVFNYDYKAMFGGLSNVEKVASTFEKSRAHLEGARTLATGLATELENLQKKENLSNGEKARSIELVKTLNGLIPDLNIEIDNETGKVDNLTGSYKELVNEMIKAAKMESINTQIKAMSDTLAESFVEQDSAFKVFEQRLAEVGLSYDEFITAREESNKKFLESTEPQTGYMQLVMGDPTLTQYQMAPLDPAIAMSQTIDPFMNIGGADWQSTTKIKKQAIITELELLYGEYDGLNKKYLSGQEFFNTEVNVLAKEFLAVSESTTDGFVGDGKKSEEERQKQREQLLLYYETVTAASQKHIDNINAITSGGFQQSSVTADEWLKSMKKNAQTQLEYNENMQKLASNTKIPATMLKQLSTMGVQHAGLIKELAGKSETDLQEWIDAWQEGAKVAGETAIKELESTRPEFSTVGTESVNNYLKPFSESQSKVTAAASLAASYANAGLNSGLNTASENGKLRAQYFEQGFRLGIPKIELVAAEAALKGNKKLLDGKSETALIGGETMQAYADSMEKNANAPAEQMGIITDNVVSQLSATSEAASIIAKNLPLVIKYGLAGNQEEAMRAARDMATDLRGIIATIDDNSPASGRAVVDGIVDGIKANKWRASNEAKDLGSTVLRSFNMRMEIKSPSRVMTTSGKQAVMGVVRGIKLNAYMASEEAKKLAEGVISSSESEMEKGITPYDFKASAEFIKPAMDIGAQLSRSIKTIGDQVTGVIHAMVMELNSATMMANKTVASKYLSPVSGNNKDSYDVTYKAIRDAMNDAGEGGDINLYIDGVYSTTVEQAKRKNLRSGKVIIPIGV